ncbi:hypothetical protein PSN45_003959 [Yamadazyma tenuis]|uniref:Pru domain-containing protein n=1 Tax=Candida tenuis (strain ATCC 10573 / BCRC 21748 / CBS 615 / JCM 9827 / NBRC 10315 / NRRL Y-1498 / VKM Y-70) TaxID=590646 RepID=G3B4K0_CANTC|nr:uncharacterized protein CANTEDRAFT_114001 [Yamadazyma tenuis ATCC 10573]EGV63964.1 hypothetical protein CANTEDRAFT_114001 [Yamadazyma tenuis ATCC 10573]WEJ96420.1 hypothetical protein PSN45_003959 [Yamadazyma tenuis]
MSTIKFNAGKVEYDEDTHECVPFPQKGVVTITPRSEEGSFYNFNWTQKSSEDGYFEIQEYLIIPGDVSFKQVSSCKTGRVLALTFLSSGAKHLFWLQDVGDDEELDKLTDKDVDLVKRINELFTPMDDEDEDEDEKPQKEEPPQPATTTNEPSTSTSAINLPILDLEDAFPFEVLETHLNRLSDKQLLELVKDDLPPTIGQNPTRANIYDLIRSGFFQQSKANLTQHLRNANGAGYLLAQSFGLEYQGEGISNFLEGIRKSSKKPHEESPSDDTTES